MAEDSFDSTLGAQLSGVDEGYPASTETDVSSGELGTADWSFLPESARAMSQGFESPESFWTALGRPESPDGYALPESWAAEGVSSEVATKVTEVLAGDREAFMRACHTSNLTAKQAESLYDVLGNILAESIGQEEAAETDPRQVLSGLWPKDTQKHLDAARRGARYAGLGEALDEAGLSKHPLVLNLARALGEAVSESSAPGKKGYVAGLPTGKRAMEEMYRLIASDAYRNNDPEAIRKVETLSRRVDMG